MRKLIHSHKNPISGFYYWKVYALTKKMLIIRNEVEKAEMSKAFFDPLWGGNGSILDIWYEKKLYDYWVSAIMPEMKRKEENLHKLRRIAMHKGRVRKKRSYQTNRRTLRKIIRQRAREELKRNKKDPEQYTRFWSRKRNTKNNKNNKL